MRQAGATLHRGARASHYRGLSCCGAQAPDVQAQQLWLTGPVALQHVGSSQTRARTRVPCIGRQILNHCATREALAICFTFGRVYMLMLLSLHPSFPLPPRILKSILNVYIFIPALPLGSSVPFFLFFSFHIYVLAYSICFSLSDLLHSV